MSEPSKTMTNPAQIEGIKLFYDFFKHLTTLSVGCIVVLATFAKSLAQLQHSGFAEFAALGFSISILSSLIPAMIYAIRAETADFTAIGGRTAAIAGKAFIVTIGSLICAIGSLAIFAIVNL
jgi:hypothetical protein